MDIPEIIWEIFLRLPYREIIRLRTVSSSILNMTRKRLFWEEKSILDFGSSIRSLNPKSPEESYIFMMAENRIVERGVERHLPIDVCLDAAFDADNLPLLQYFFSFTSPADRRFFFAFLNEWEDVLPLCASSSKSMIRMVAYYLGKEGKERGLDILIRSHITYTDIIINAARSGAKKAKRKKMLNTIDKYQGKNLFSLIFS